MSTFYKDVVQENGVREAIFMFFSKFPKELNVVFNIMLVKY